MASRGDNITTKFNADVSGFKKGIQEAERQIKLANSQFKAASAGMDDWSKSSVGLSAKLEQLRSNLTAHNQKLENYKKILKEAEKAEQSSSRHVDNLRQALERVKQEYGENSQQVKELQKKLGDAEKEENRLKNAVVQATTSMNSQQAAVNGTERELQTFERRLDQVQDAEAEAARSGRTVEEVMEDMERSTQQASDGFTVMKGALASLVADGIRNAISALKDFAKASFEVGAEFDKSMAKVAAVSGASGEDFAKLEAKARELGESTQFSASEASEALNYMAMAGWKTKDMLDGIGGVLSLAAASGSDLATTSDIVTDALTAMGYTAKDVGRFADVMAAASSNANTTVEAMGLAFQYAAPLAGALNYSIEDLSVGISMMSNAGIKGEKAGTALRSIFTRLASPPKAAATAMEELGISITESSGKMKPFREVISQLRDKFAELNEVEQAEQASKLAGQEAMSGLLAIVNAAPADFEKLINAVDNSAGSAEHMAKIMNDNVAGDLTSLKSKIEGVQITLYKKLEPTIRKVIKGLQDWANSVDWDKVGNDIAEAVGKIVDVFSWIVKNKAPIIAALKAIIAAFAIAKVSQWANAIATGTKNIASLIIGLANGTKAYNTQTRSIIANTTATTAGTAATRLFSAAWKANPIGLAITAVTLLTTGLISMVKYIQKAHEETNKDIIATRELAKAHKELTGELAETAKARSEAISSADDEVAATDVLIDRVVKLADKENKTNTEKKTLLSLVEQLNQLMPELNLKYDEEKDKLNMSTEALKANTAAQKELLKAKAVEAQLQPIAEDLVKTEKEREGILKQLEQNQLNFNKARQALGEWEAKYGTDSSQWTIAQRKEHEQLIANMDKESKALEEARRLLSENTNETTRLNQEFDKTTQIASKLYNQAEINQKIAALTELAKAQGRDIPTALAQGMRDGNYVVPETIAQMDALIKFDDALQKAHLAGQEIPSAISQNILAGKLSVQDAIEQVKAYVNFNDKVAQATADGVAIPSNFAQSIRDNGTPVDEAMKQLQSYVDFSTSLQKATEAGVAIPNGLAENVRNGSMTLQEAVTQLQASSDFNELKQKAEATGIEIPYSMSQGIVSGATAPSEALQKLQTLMDYQTMLDQANVSGAGIPKSIQEGILSGQKSVVDATAEMQRWIDFQQALETTTVSANQIPQKLAEGILNGSTNVKLAADTVKANLTDGFGQLSPKLNELGKQNGINWNNGIIAGLNDEGKRGAIKRSINTTGQGISRDFGDAIDAHSPSRKAETLAGYYLDGIAQGLNNGGKQSYIYGIIRGIGDRMLATLKASLQEHSPSKATNKMGQYLIQGLGIGMAKKEKGVVKQISTLGKKVLTTFSKTTAGKYEKVGNSTIKQYTSGIKSATKTSIAAVKDMVNATVKSLGKSNKKAKADYKKAGTATINAYSTAIQNGTAKATAAVEKSIGKLAAKAQSKYDDIIESRKNLRDALNESGDLFATKTTGELYLGTLGKSAKKITDFGKNLEKLKKKVPNGLMNEILGLDTDTGQKLAKTLVGLSSKELKSYVSAYNAREKASKKVSDTYYKNELTSVQKGFKTSVNKELKGLSTSLTTIGKNSIAGLIDGMTSQKKKLTGTAKTMATTIVNTLKKQLKIKSPSKLLADSVGQFIPAGIAEGIEENVSVLQRAMQNMAGSVTDMSQSAFADTSMPAFAGNTANEYKFTQIINAPKQPSRAELYRQSKNLIKLAGGK